MPILPKPVTREQLELDPPEIGRGCEPILQLFRR